MINRDITLRSKITGLFLFQVTAGLLCILLSWYQVIPLFISIALLVVLSLKFRWWAYLLVFLAPIITTKAPSFTFAAKAYNGAKGSIPLFFILSLFAALTLLIHKWSGQEQDKVKSPLFVPLLVFAGYSLLTIFWSPVTLEFNIIYGTYLISAMLFFYYMFHAVDSEEFHRRLMWCIVLAGIALAAQVFVAYFYIREDGLKIEVFDWLLLNVFQKPQRNQRTGLFAAYSGTAVAIDIAIIVSMGLLLNEKNKAKKWFLRITIPLLIAAVISTGNKGGSWSLFFTMYLFLFISRHYRNHLVRNGIIVLLVFIYLLSPLSFIKRRGSTPRAVGLKSTAEEGSSLGQRLTFWGEGFRQVDKRSLELVGLGVGGYSGLNNLGISQPHNVIFHVYYDFGIVGIIIIGAIFLVLLRMFLKIAKHQETYMQNMFIAFTVNLVGIGMNGVIVLPYNSGLLWFSIAMYSVTYHLVRKELKEKESLPEAKEPAILRTAGSYRY